MTRVPIRSEGWLSAGVYTKASELDLTNEARELEKCERLGLATRNVGAVALISFDKSKNELATRWVDGENLFNPIWNATSRLGWPRGRARRCELLTARLHEIGEWLIGFHRAGAFSGSPQEALIARSAAARCIRQLFFDKLTKVADYNILSSGLVGALRDFGSTLEEGLVAGTDLKLSVIHGDFVPHNMCVDGADHIHVLDFADSRFGFALEDVARFWEQIEEIVLAHGGRGRWLTAASAGFLRSYGLDPAITRSGPFVALRLLNALTTVHVSLKFRKYFGFSDRLIAIRMKRAALQSIQRTLPT